MGVLAQRARERNESFTSLIDRERERLRTQFVHCKNAATLRAALTDFWSRAGRTLPTLQEHWPLILPYLTETRWELARDLALLALVSYRPPAEAAEADEVETDAAIAAATA